MDPIDCATADAVRKAIRRAGLIQAGVARESEIKSRTWSRRMKGQRPFTMAELIRVCRAVGIRPTDLVDEIWEKVA